MDRDFDSLCRSIDNKNRQLRALSEDHTSVWIKWMNTDRVARAWRSLSLILIVATLISSAVMFSVVWQSAEVAASPRARAAQDASDSEMRQERDHYRLALVTAVSLYEDALRHPQAHASWQGDAWSGFNYIFFGNGDKSIDLPREREWARGQLGIPLIYFGDKDPGMYVPVINQ